MFRKKKSSLPYTGIRSYVLHAFYHLKHAFIPHTHNNHYPHALRTRALITYGVFLIVLKIGITSILFITFPDYAKLSKENIEHIFTLTNEARQKQNLDPLSLDPYLTFVAEQKVNDMMEKMYFSHYTPEGYAPWYFIDEQYYNYSFAGENLAMNFVEMDSVHQAFMASPGHRDNILHPDFKDVGFAIARAEIDGTETQVLVQYFGSRKNTSLFARSDEPLPNFQDDTVTQEDTSILATENVLGDEFPVVAEKVTDSKAEFNFSEELIVFASPLSERSPALVVYDFTHKLFIFFLAFMLVSLFINIIVRIRVQHGRLLLQSSLLIILIVAIIVTRFHFVEDINQTLQIY